MKKTYNFKQQLKIGKKGEHILDIFFKNKFHIKQVSLQTELEEGIDRIFINKKSGKKFSVEYKRDDMALKTGNLFIETLSNSSNGKLGWIFWSQSYRVMILVGGIIYSLKTEELREYIKKEGDRYKERSCKNKTYYSVGKLMPIKDLVKLKSLIVFRGEK